MAAENSIASGPRQRRRVFYGALLIAGLFAGALLIFFLDDLRHAFRSTYRIVAVIPGAAGLSAGSPVWVSGREVGTVTAVGVLPAGSDTLARVVVHIELPVSVQPHVRRDSRVRLTSVNLMSERAVDILAGTTAMPQLGEGDTLRQAVQVTPAQLAQRAQVVKLELDSALAAVRTHAPALRALLLGTQRAFDGLDDVILAAGQLQTDVDASPGLALLRDPAFTTSLDNTRAHAARLSSALDTLRQRTGAASDVRVALTQLQLRADSLRALLVAAEVALDNPNGTLARIQQDSALTRALHAARAELDLLIADARRNPLRYVY